MTKRVSWKKGMRLTDEVFRMSDRYHAELVERAFLFAAAGRFGLLPSNNPFRLSLDIQKNIVEVVELNCLGLTRDGHIIDISFDSCYSKAGDTRIAIPTQSEDRAYMLLVSVTDQWTDIGNSTCEPIWQYSLIDENSPIPDDALPLARIVNDMGWREDTINFLPPCLLLSAHERYIQQSTKYYELLKKMDILVFRKLNTESGDARKVFWPEVRRLCITMDKESDIMTPMSLLASIQECISAFHCACLLDKFLNLTEADKYAEYIREPYNFKDCFLKIEEGLSLTTEICQKLENITDEPSHVQEPSTPWIQETDLHTYATSNNVRIEVFGLDPNSHGYYSLDGSDPTKPLQGGRFVPINPEFNKTRSHEDDRTYMVKLKSILDGHTSKVASFNLIVTKNVTVWKGFQI